MLLQVIRSRRYDGRVYWPEASGRPVVIFDCNGVLVDSEPIANAVLADAFGRAGVGVTADTLAQRFHGRRLSDICKVVRGGDEANHAARFRSDGCGGNAASGLRAELRAVPHACPRTHLDPRAEGRGIVLGARSHPLEP